MITKVAIARKCYFLCRAASFLAITSWAHFKAQLCSNYHARPIHDCQLTFLLDSRAEIDFRIIILLTCARHFREATPSHAIAAMVSILVVGYDDDAASLS